MAILVSGNTVITDDAVLIAGSGNTASRPAVPVQGMIRFNTTTVTLEGFNGSQWLQIGTDELSRTLLLLDY